MGATTTVTGRRDRADSRELSGRFLTVVHHENAACIGARVPISDGEPLLLGRGGLALGAGVLDDRELSRTHARIVSGRSEVVLHDDGSRNGTFVNGARVQSATLRDGDVITVGSMLLLFQHGAPDRRGVALPGPEARAEHVARNVRDLLHAVERAVLESRAGRLQRAASLDHALSAAVRVLAAPREHAPPPLDEQAEAPAHRARTDGSVAPKATPRAPKRSARRRP